MNKRYHELDGLRGLAALFVVFSHIDAMFGKSFALVNYSPLRLLVAGGQSVLLFFILSGFVLSLPYHANREKSYGHFVVSRIFRIWVPYMASICLAIVGKQLFFHMRPPMSGWLQLWWYLSVTPKVLIDHMLMLGIFDMSLNPVIWSLIHEMRISLLFPFLMILIRRFSPGKVLAFGMLLSLISITLLFAGINNSFGDTLHYTMFFIFGALLAKYPIQIKRTKLLLVIALFVFTFSNLYVQGAPMKWIFANNWITGLAAAALIIIALQDQQFKGFLNSAPVQFLGEISYSLYLVHVPVMLALFYAFDLSLAMVAVLTPFATLIAATVFYFLVESPAMQIGRRVTTKVRLAPAYSPSNMSKNKKPVA